MKLRYTFLLVILSVIFNISVTHAEEDISTPTSVLNEGLETQLTDEQIESILPWANNSKIYIEDLISLIKSMTFEQALMELERGYTDVVLSSAPDNAQVLLRFSLNRALEYSKILSAEVEKDAVGIVDIKTRFLKVAADLALEHFQSDILLLEKKTDNIVDLKFKYAIFGISFADKFLHVARSIVDASAQHRIYLTTLKFLQLDLYRDLDRNRFAVEIRKIQNLVRTLELSKPSSDFDIVDDVRQMKSLIKSLRLSNLLTELNDEKARILQEIVTQRNSEIERQKLEELKKNKKVFAKYIQSLTGKAFESPTRDFYRGEDVGYLESEQKFIEGKFVQNVSDKEVLLLINGSPLKVNKNMVVHKNICTLGFCTGDKAYSVKMVNEYNYSYRRYFETARIYSGEVVGGSIDDDILLKSVNGESVTYQFLSIKDSRYYVVGCSGPACVGDAVYVLNKEYKSSKIVGIDGEGKYLIEAVNSNDSVVMDAYSESDIIKL
ncbi:hypothetical protein M899_1362 [Bacteriovorax sp. BSW11_IV]|uniref:hypothetical protein n=1 Tax=Bacteriovorax sp. BSW11_IV TaxID=1353529 RepID=UPI00038A3682|nr:hypothetical protein [Bacteriovorax sp. BSW11_IV]EQC45814.1 hypothetical protein M899_1362 [Bacteriovorax sp. BSW11_IV]